MSRALPLAALVAAVPGVASAQMSFDQLARTTALTAADDYRIGKGYFDWTRYLQGTDENPEKLAELEETVRRIVASSDRPDTIFHVALIPSPEVNAAALPGGFLLVYQGLLDAMPPEQVAFVLGHEVSHVQLRHFATTMNMTNAMQVLAVGGEAMEGSDRAVVEASYGQLEQLALSYARNLELEADLYGMLYAVRAGWPASAGAGAMASIRNAVGEIPDTQTSTHPSFGERIHQMEQGLATVQETWALFDAGAQFARDGSWEACTAAFEQFLTLFPKSASAWSNLGACHLQTALATFPPDPWIDDIPVYTRADVVVRAVDKAAVERAKAAFGKAIEIDPNRDAPWAALAVLARRSGETKAASELLAKARKLDPKYGGYANNEAVLAAAAGNWKDADRLFAEARRADKDAAYVIVNQAVAFETKKKPKDAVPLWRELEDSPRYSARARERLLALGETPKAVEEEDYGVVGLIGVLGSVEGAVDGGVIGGTVGGTIGGLGGAGTGPAVAVGPLSVGMGADAAITALGKPDGDELFDDGYYRYLTWLGAGVAASFTDDALVSIEVFAPATLKTAEGIALGSDRAAIERAYGGADWVSEDPSTGYAALWYELRGVSFFLAGEIGVQSISVWRP